MKVRNYARFCQYLLLVLQVGAAAVAVHLYQIEGSEFFELFLLIAAGFVVNILLPSRLRLPFFVLLSLAGSFVVFAFEDALWLIGCGLLLIMLCHLPVPFVWRLPVLLGVAILLAVSRSGAITAPWSSAIWPILGSMFMFRLVLYARAVKRGEARGGWWSTLAYFFMVPNLVFPLFPVVDYHAFERTRYDRDEIAIYQQGILWIVRGLFHLLLYRLVYHAALNDPADVDSLGDLFQFMLSTILLYLRVSGSFHLIVGILHLFGFRLPETHRLYYLAHDFTELWRRINIYWKDFMSKVVFYPVYFRVKDMGAKKSLAIATAAVFSCTWLLHSYQWFWLRGDFPVALPDILFWGLLGILVVRSVVKDRQPITARRSPDSRWDFRRGLRVAGTFAVFCTLWSLWSMDSVVAWLWLLSAAANIDAKGIALLAVAFVTLFVLGSRSPRTSGRSGWSWRGLSVDSAARSTAGLLALLIASNQTLQGAVPDWAAEGLRSFKLTGLNTRDAALQHRGYYEQLDVRASLNSRVLDISAAKPAGWQDLSAMGLIRERSDLLLRDLYPSRSVVWNGNPFTTNRWGMRDVDYPLNKPDGVLRIALLGPSHVMANGVADGESFESLIEVRLNEERPLGSAVRFELLNFGIDGFSVAQQVALLDQRVIGFDPDVVIITSHRRDMVVMEQYLLKLMWQDIPIPHASLRELLSGAGLLDVDRGELSLPFEWLRQTAKSLGVRPRIPQSEAEFRARRIAAEAFDWSVQRFVQLSLEHDFVPLVLALNAVVDDPLPDIPRRQVFEQAGVPVINLLDIFPESDRSKLRVGPWDDHPNSFGHMVIADRLYAELLRHLEGGSDER